MIEYERNINSTQPCLGQVVKAYAFLNEEGRWHLHLPQYFEQGWSKADLEIVEGGRKLLNNVARGRKKATLLLSTEPFPGADMLELLELCAAPKGGGIYLLKTCNGKAVNKRMWICDITLFVFGDMAEQFYVQKVGKTS